MLTKYIYNAMRKAVYDKLEDGTFSGKIPPCPGVIAFGASLSECQETLREALEGWIIVKLRHGDTLPIIARTNLNEKRTKSSKKVLIHG
jgi:predicted RNase H-like HicB family nuclease